GAIDYHQNGAIGIESALDQVSQKRFTGRPVLGCTFPQPQYLLSAVAPNADSRQHYMAGESAPHRSSSRPAQVRLDLGASVRRLAAGCPPRTARSPRSCRRHGLRTPLALSPTSAHSVGSKLPTPSARTPVRPVDHANSTPASSAATVHDRRYCAP